uniref:Uncharacterized protein n=1 Tax=Vitis vinifera TaxID=29760 RepID=A5BJM4_VITVI|nr:hypothetical protein VITISV_008646 [Vitis vinifera]
MHLIYSASCFSSVCITCCYLYLVSRFEVAPSIEFHGLFERALSNDRLRHSVLLWRCYIAYEIDIASNPSAARRVFFPCYPCLSMEYDMHIESLSCKLKLLGKLVVQHDIRAWFDGRSKKLWLDGFQKLKSVLSAKEMSDLQEVMRDKELNVRTDIYEILLQDDVGP